ncbi:putative glycolipid-binding domain-containing protein [Rhizobiaceae bacterium BDR2-2]|uniref:Glycolipid-binding domain-containing protein n=1 Tax=Ectorhizobium quercum TaxID=2965071 RepID=A0AAE3MWD8_9HYPH|nr:putative glycolipid-binding domain-containing protein [Ectorhizobium quercum]MCX8995521.1 putative glycolipid-binding domain-containing protein [Ectorhizobium quercum]
MKTIVRWCDWQGNGLEHCYMREGPEGLLLEGVVAGTREGLYGACYTVRTVADFRTREVRVSYVDGPQLHVTADGEGHWHDMIGRVSIPALDGAIDVDIGVTPATNTLPVKRLRLEPCQSRDIVAAYVPLPAQVDGPFLPRPAKQRYTCLVANRRYRYEGLFRGFSAELEFDAAGLVLDYPDTFRRILPA